MPKINHQELGQRQEYLPALAFLLKSLGDENRLKILLTLSNGKKSVSGMVEDLGLSQPLVSHHLKELRRALLVNVERAGPFIYYELAEWKILDILKSLEGLTISLLSKRKTF